MVELGSDGVGGGVCWIPAPVVKKGSKGGVCRSHDLVEREGECCGTRAWWGVVLQWLSSCLVA